MSAFSYHSHNEPGGQQKNHRQHAEHQDANPNCRFDRQPMNTDPYRGGAKCKNRQRNNERCNLWPPRVPRFAWAHVRKPRPIPLSTFIDRIFFSKTRNDYFCVFASTVLLLIFCAARADVSAPIELECTAYQVQHTISLDLGSSSLSEEQSVSSADGFVVHLVSHATITEITDHEVRSNTIWMNGTRIASQMTSVLNRYTGQLQLQTSSGLSLRQECHVAQKQF
jgi:hypothetical protein